MIRENKENCFSLVSLKSLFVFPLMRPGDSHVYGTAGNTLVDRTDVLLAQQSI